MFYKVWSNSPRTRRMLSCYTAGNYIQSEPNLISTLPPVKLMAVKWDKKMTVRFSSFLSLVVEWVWKSDRSPSCILTSIWSVSNHTFLPILAIVWTPSPSLCGALSVQLGIAYLLYLWLSSPGCVHNLNLLFKSTHSRMFIIPVVQLLLQLSYSYSPYIKFRTMAVFRVLCGITEE